jgi:DNA-binding beta-propeller fold protein YncE
MQSQSGSKCIAGLAGLALAMALLGAPRNVSAQSSCLGDCDGSDEVNITDLIIGVNIALGLAPISTCPAFNNGSGMVTIDVLITAVNNSLFGCPATPTATRTDTAAATATVTVTHTMVGTATATHTAGATNTGTVTRTATQTGTPTGTASATVTNTPAATGTPTETQTPSQTPTATEPPFLERSSKSSSIAVSDDEFIVALVNPDSGTLSVFAAGTNIRLSEVAVGTQPVAVVIHPNNRTAFVANRADATVVRVDEIDTPNPVVSDPVAVGSEPTGLALSPSGNTLFVAEWAEGNVSVIDTASLTIVGGIENALSPRAVAVTNDGDRNDDDETLIVTEFYGRPNTDISGCPSENAEVCDTGRIGRLHRYNISDLSPQSPILFQPIDSGFAPSTDPPDAPTVMTAPNQLYSAAVQGGKVYVTSVSASPQPPINFQANVFPVLYVGDLATGMEDLSNVGSANLARLVFDQIPPESTRRFLQEIVDLAFDGDSNVAYVVSRAADTVQQLTYDPNIGIIVGTTETRQINVSPDCQNPIGIAIAPERRRAYVNCWITRRMGVINLDAQVLTEAPQSAALPTPNTIEDDIRLGQRFYFTGRGRWSNGGNGFSSCGSCHPDGLSDNITWSFAAGPRQSTSMDGSFSHGAGAQQQRQFNWTGIFDEIHDFERNTRGVSGGLGAITTSPTNQCGILAAEQPVDLPADGLGLPVKVVQDTTPGVCTHDWDKIDAFAKTIRPPRARQFLDPAAVARGATLFTGDGACHTCHAGAGFTAARRFWTPSEINNDALMLTPFEPPTNDPFWSFNPFQISGEVAMEGGMEVAPNEISCGLRNVGTFGIPGGTTATMALERRANGMLAQGGGGFTIPSLYGLSVGAPYFHHGQATTLAEVLNNPLWAAHLKAGNASFTPNVPQIADLLAYLYSIDADAPEPELRQGFDGCPSEFPTYRARLTGGQEVPPVATSASADAVLQLNEDDTELTYEVRISGIDPAQITQAHLHVGPPGFNGPVVLFLADMAPSEAVLRGTLTAADLIPSPDVGVQTFAQFIAALKAGDVYVNVHTIMHMGGEIRGQVDAPIELVSTLNGNFEVPPVITSATGSASFELSADRTRLRYTVDVSGIDPSEILQAHLHVAPLGVNGPVVLFLTGAPPITLPLQGELSAADLIPNADVGVINFDDFVERLLAGDVYVNVHTLDHPNGEIRGQVAAPQVFPAPMDGQQEVPPVATAATGRTRLQLNAEGTEIRFALATTGITPADILQAHLHAAPRGFNGPVIFGLANGPFGLLRMGTLTAADLMPNGDAGIENFADFLEALRAGDIYSNLHTMDHMSGEIRGQVLPPTEFVAELSGAEEVPPVVTDASGESRIALAPDEQSMRVVLVVDDLPAEEIMQAHIHVGPVGENGPVAFFLAEAGFASPLLVSLTAADFLPSPQAPSYEDFLDALRAGDTYVNVHTFTNEDGEIRGQIQAPVTVGATLTGAQEVPPVVTTATGRGQVVISADRTRMRFALTTDLDSGQIEQAHIHVAPAGMNGGVAFFLADSGFMSPVLGTLTPDDFLAPPEAPTYADFVADLLGGGTYMNVHTVMFMDGEIRGQLE